MHKKFPPKFQYNILCLVGFISKHKLWEEDEPSGLLRLRIRNLNESWGNYSYVSYLFSLIQKFIKVRKSELNNLQNLEKIYLRMFTVVRPSFTAYIWFQEIKHLKDLSLAFLDVLQRNLSCFCTIYQNLRFFFLSTQPCYTFKLDD